MKTLKEDEIPDDLCNSCGQPHEDFFQCGGCGQVLCKSCKDGHSCPQEAVDAYYAGELQILHSTKVETAAVIPKDLPHEQ